MSVLVEVDNSVVDNVSSLVTSTFVACILKQMREGVGNEREKKKEYKMEISPS